MVESSRKTHSPMYSAFLPCPTVLERACVLPLDMRDLWKAVSIAIERTQAWKSDLGSNLRFLI